MAIVSVHALSTGSLTLPERFFITPADQDARRTVPSLSFLIQHTTTHSGQQKTNRIVFDLGLRRDLALYPETLQKHCASRSPMTTTPDAVASLAEGNLTPSDIDYVVFSHVHYDHVGLPSDFPSSKFIVGNGALDLLSGKTQLNIGSHSFFESDLLPSSRTIELPSPTSPSSSETSSDINLSWSKQPLPGFEHTADIFNDGTVYIVNAPGHLPGHINLLVRTSPSKSILLAGDACHDIRLFTGERDIATWQDGERTCCIHYDIPRAKKTIEMLAKVGREGTEIDGKKVDVEVVFAHNWQWEEEAKRQGRFWPGQM